MKEELFAELMESLAQALDHAKGRRELRTTILPATSEQIAAIEGTERCERTKVPGGITKP